jgi:F0F1-type ATP synthase assembly protein I
MAKEPDNNWGRMGGIGLEIGVAVGLGVVIGYWIDGHWNSGPWGVLIGALLGLAAGFYLLIRDVIRLNKD